MMDLTLPQQQAIYAENHVMLWGNAGTGKTTALHHRLTHLLDTGVSAYNILTLVSEYGHEQPFLELLHESELGAYSDLHITTYNSLAREMVVLFWPLVARPAGFTHPAKPPTFLEYDMAQLLMWRILTPMQAEGAFSNLRLRPQRIVSQLIDILNRAAFNGLTLENAIRRQAQIFSHEPDRLENLADATQATKRFRQFCFDNSLLDFSLTIEVFDTYLVKHPEFHRYFQERYQHVLVDNIEEHTAAAQSFVFDQLRGNATVALALDDGGGYRRFLSADPTNAATFKQYCEVIDFNVTPLTSTLPLRHLGNVVEDFLLLKHGRLADEAHLAVLDVVKYRYRREVLADLPQRLLTVMAEHGVAAHEVAFIAPYLDGALEYTLQQELKNAGIPYRLLRRRSSPRDEPRIRAWLTWLALAHPQWGMHPAGYDVAEAMSLSLHGLDPVRAALLVRHLYQADTGTLLSTDGMAPQIIARVGEDLVESVEQLRLWLVENSGQLTVDDFLYQLFHNVLAQPPYQPDPEHALDAAAVCDWLVKSASNLRRSAANIGLKDEADIGQAFLDGIYQGLVTANPPDLGDPPDPNGAVIATIYGYLLSGVTSKIQVWLDAGIMGWWQTPFQPLSNAFVMVQSRPESQLWTAQEEIEIRNELLSHVIRGLTNRCTHGVVLAVSDLDRAGQRQNGVLWRALQPVRNKLAG